MQLSSRQRQLLNFLLLTQAKVTISYLAEKFSVAPRTIRYDLDALADYLAFYKAVQLYRQPRKGIWLECSAAGRQLLLTSLEDNQSALTLSPAERRQLILGELLTAAGPITVRYLEQISGYSESTLLKDLDALEPWFARHKLTLIRKPSYGLAVEGNELALRQGMVAFLADVLVPVDFEAFVNCPEACPLQQYVRKLIEPEAVKKYAAVVRKWGALLNSRFADESYIALVLHLGVAHRRFTQGKVVALDERQSADLKTKTEYVAIEKGLSLAGSGIHLSAEEKAVLALQVLSSPRVKSGDDDIRAELCQQLALEIASMAEGMLGGNLSGDSKFLDDLAQHLKPTIERIQMGIAIENPLLDSIKERYPQYMEAANATAGIIQGHLQNKISEHEIGLIALHIGAAAERQRQRRQRLPRAVLACASGLGTANILTVRINQEFPGLKIVATASIFNVRELAVETEADIIISTVPLEANLPVVVVDPLLAPRQVDAIRAVLEQKGCSSVLRPQETYDFISMSMIEIIERYAYVFDRRGLLEQIDDLLASLEFARELRIPPGDRGESLLHLLPPTNIKVVDRPDNWQQAVHTTGGMLVAAGAAEAQYVQQMVAQIEEHGPYVVVTPNTALLHAPGGKDVKRPAFSLSVYPRGVNFGHNRFDPVKLVFAFCSPDKQSHLRALKGLMQVISDGKVVGKILAATEARTIFELIKIKLGGGGSG